MEKPCGINLRGRGVFLKSRYMDDSFLKRVTTPKADKTRGQGLVKKEQGPIFVISTGSFYN
jgi:hypothetical protein